VRRKLSRLALAAGLLALGACSKNNTTSPGQTHNPSHGDGDDGSGDGDDNNGDGDGNHGDGDSSHNGDGDTSSGDGDTSSGDGDTSSGDGDTSHGDGDTSVGDGDSTHPITGSPYDCEWGEPVIKSLDASTSPPGGLAVDNVPQFISLGWDDNRFVSGIDWALDLIHDKTNPKGKGNECTFDGSPARFTFYVISSVDDTSDEIKAAHKRMYAQGNEVGNHTNTHAESLMMNADVNVWKSEIGICNNYMLSDLGIPGSAIQGFRTPFLSWSDATFDAVSAAGFKYDCSIEHFNQGNGYSWPYTLDHSSSLTYRKPTGSYPGLWEAPVNELPQGDALWQGITGLDYNMWDVAHYSKAQVVKAMETALKVRMEGRTDFVANRAPLFIGMHTDLYSPENETVGSVAADRRAAIEEFIEFAIAYHPDVRIVPAAQVIRWMQNPVGLDGTKGK
jgi:peptidoglycan/xylan/chitin deacetylase (PgdA/CDA1 family)